MASLMIALGLAVPLLLRRPAELSPNAMAPIETLVSEAHAAGSRTNYVYPPQEDHLAATSYIKVLELESLEGPLAEPGRLRAQALRTEFAATLVSLGNKYWAHESARPWAYEYYTQALLFSPEHPTARERNVLTPTSLAALAQRAKRREFTPDELGFAQIVNALANTNTQRQEAELAAVMKKGKAPPMQESLARRALAATGVATPVPRVNADPITPVKDTLDSSSDSKAGEGSPSNRATQPRHAASSVARDGETPSFVPDRGRARELTKQAALERAQGRRVEAERLYHQATSHNPSDTAALIGLSEIYFDQGRYDESVRYAERAVKSAPKHANAYLQLGDALFKVLRYQDALAAYARAEKFGSKKAKERAAKVRAKLGTGN
jgi:tetratricopeptide (TPR) repeat protein